jgi:hypothetical protein
LRDTVLLYLTRLPFTTRTANAFARLFTQTQIFDDVTRFKLVEAAVHWRVPFNSAGRTFAATLSKFLQKPATAFEWFCLVYFLAKYGEPHEVLTAARRSEGYRAKEPFFARQSMVVLPHALGINEARVKSLWRREISAGTTDSASVATNLGRFLRTGFPTSSHRTHFYLFPKVVREPYPIAKFLLLCVLAKSEAKNGVMVKRPEVSTHVQDPWFRQWLKGLQPYWF